MAARLSVRPGAGAPARSLNPQVDEDGLPRYFMGLAGGGSVSDLAQVVSELNPGMQVHGRPGARPTAAAAVPTAGGAGPSSLPF